MRDVNVMLEIRNDEGEVEIEEFDMEVRGFGPEDDWEEIEVVSKDYLKDLDYDLDEWEVYIDVKYL